WWAGSRGRRTGRGRRRARAGGRPAWGRGRGSRRRAYRARARPPPQAGTTSRRQLGAPAGGQGPCWRREGVVLVSAQAELGGAGGPLAPARAGLEHLRALGLLGRGGLRGQPGA